MKKLVLLTLLVALFGTVVNAQVKIGVMGGPSFVNFTGSEIKEWGSLDSEPSMKVKFHLGFYFIYPINDQLSIEARILYSAKGPQYSGNAQEYDDQTFEMYSGTKTITKQLSYLELPILVNYKVHEKIVLFAGPQVGFRLAANARSEFTGTSQGGSTLTTDKTSNQNDYYSGIDFGLLVGIGYELSDKLGVNLAYNPGLSKIAQYEYEGEVTKYDVKNSAILISLRYVLKQ
ncbi:MAG: PorT family protein [Cyclobacteriaceae bacterium]|nr:PorT family protein [Cyclobacteriaceae bacterium]